MLESRLTVVEGFEAGLVGLVRLGGWQLLEKFGYNSRFTAIETAIIDGEFVLVAKQL